MSSSTIYLSLCPAKSCIGSFLDLKWGGSWARDLGCWLRARTPSDVVAPPTSKLLEQALLHPANSFAFVCHPALIAFRLCSFPSPCLSHLLVKQGLLNPLFGFNRAVSLSMSVRPPSVSPVSCSAGRAHSSSPNPLPIAYCPSVRVSVFLKTWHFRSKMPACLVTPC